jgi:ribonuclease-3
MQCETHLRQRWDLWRTGFAQPDLLDEALTHPSFTGDRHTAQRGARHNQRLEFLGDAVLQLLCTEFLFRSHPEEDEGSLTKMRAPLVNGSALARLAGCLDLGKHIKLGRSESKNTGPARSSVLADAMEAVLGAIYVDGGWDHVQRFSREVLEPFWREVLLDVGTDNPKGQLQEALQALGGQPPEYRVLETSGPDHARHFSVAAWWGNVELGKGEGGSKREAEVHAASEALEARRWLADPSRP